MRAFRRGLAAAAQAAPRALAGKAGQPAGRLPARRICHRSLHSTPARRRTRGRHPCFGADPGGCRAAAEAAAAPPDGRRQRRPGRALREASPSLPQRLDARGPHRGAGRMDEPRRGGRRNGGGRPDAAACSRPRRLCPPRRAAAAPRSTSHPRRRAMMARRAPLLRVTWHYFALLRFTSRYFALLRVTSRYLQTRTYSELTQLTCPPPRYSIYVRYVAQSTLQVSGWWSEGATDLRAAGIHLHGMTIGPSGQDGCRVHPGGRERAR